MNPKLLIARAAAPMFNGLRGDTSTTRRFSFSPLLLEIGVSVEPFLVEPQQPAGLLVSNFALPQRCLDILPELIEQRPGVELDVIENFAHGVALNHGVE